MKKVFISTDMEGIAESRAKAHVDKRTKIYTKFARIQSLELAEIINAIGTGARFVIRDAHSTAENVLPELLPDGDIKLLSAWRNTNEFGMMSGLDKSFDFAILHGYHAAAGTKLSPLAHTFDSSAFSEIRLNNRIAGEVTFALYKAAYIGTPVAMITGDFGAIKEAQSISPNIITVQTKKFPNNILPAKKVRELIARAAPRAARMPADKLKIELPKSFVLHISYIKPYDALSQSQRVPGVRLISKNTIEYKTDDFGTLLKTLRRLKITSTNSLLDKIKSLLVNN